MLRTILAAVLGVIVYFVVTEAGGYLTRAVWPDYAAVGAWMTPTMPIGLRVTLPLMLARLTLGAVAALSAGLASGVIARQRLAAALVTGAILTVLFGLSHWTIWLRFPLWYHLAFLGSLIPLSVLAATLVKRVSSPR